MSQTKKAITTTSAPAPVGPYNQAILAGGWLYCSGQIALDPSSGAKVGNGDVEKETSQVLSNLLAVLEASGAVANQVVKCNIYLVDLNDFDRVNKLYAEIFDQGISPARACVQVAALPKGCLVEIDCIAWLGQTNKRAFTRCPKNLHKAHLPKLRQANTIDLLLTLHSTDLSMVIFNPKRPTHQFSIAIKAGLF